MNCTCGHPDHRHWQGTEYCGDCQTGDTFPCERFTPEGGGRPYPHTRNDCGSCQERDADLSINYELRPGLGTVRNLCTGCVADFLLSLARQGPHGITVDLPHREGS